MMRVASVCSGIGGAELAFQGIASHAFAAETDPFARAVLAYRFPDLKVHHDFTQIPASAGPVDVLVGGTPCQSFSIAGLRGGMADERGNLALEFLRLAERLRARWILWENVPGVLSSNEGRDFGAFIGGLAELGYGYCWRSLDAQYFGLAQRRVRVFVVGYLGDWRPAAAVLAEPSSLRGHPAPSREAGKTTAPTLASRASAGGGLGTDFDCDGGLIAASLRGTGGADETDFLSVTHRRPMDTHLGSDLISGLDANYGKGPGMRGAAERPVVVTHSLRADGFDAGEDGTGRGTPLTVHSLNGAHSATEDGTGRGVPLVAFDARQSDTITYGDMSGPLDTDGHSVAVAFTLHGANKTISTASDAEVAQSMRARSYGGIENSSTTVALQRSAVRRLLPIECERLQGFPDGWTDVVYRGKPAADGARYKCLGNAFAIPVVRWIARRIVREDALALALAEAAA